MSIIGMWMWPYRVNLFGAKAVVSLCARAKVTDIYFLTKGLNGSTAFHGEDAPHDSERDLLQELIEAAHEKNIKVHAWFTSASDSNYKKLYPESGRCHYANGKDCGLISLADEGYINYMKKITTDLCTRYDIDGIHLDYIRYNHMVYGWSEEDLARYAANGADAVRLKAMVADVYDNHDGDITPLLDAYRAGDKDLIAFAKTRRADVWNFASEITKTARCVNPNLTLSAALMPEGAYTDHAFADLHYGQNYEDAAKLYDYVLPMAYSQAYEKGGEWVRMVADNTVSICKAENTKTVMGLHAYEDGTALTLQEDIAALQGAPIEGICLFREGSCVLAFRSGNTVHIYNPINDPITSLIVSAGEENVSFDCNIKNNEEQEFTFPFEADLVRAFVGDTEVSVYLTE